jgi:exodeoxyribonuclease V alpha subunit
MTITDTSNAATLEGHIERVTFYNKENHFAIARFRTDKTNTLVTVLGTLPQLSPGEALRVTGNWETHARYGQQLRITSVETVLPATVEGIKSYLASGFIKGVGPKTVRRLVDHFKEKTLAVIENSPESLSEVQGIGRETALRISAAWESHHVLRRLMQFLQENGINTSYGAKIFKAYGTAAIDILCNDPLRVAHDIPGIGFLVADTILQNTGAAPNDPIRIQACVLHVLEQQTDAGHIYTLVDHLIDRCEQLFKIEAGDALSAVKQLHAANELVIEAPDASPEQAVYLKPLHAAESGIAGRLKALLTFPVQEAGPDRERITREVLRKLAIQLSTEQLQVLEHIFSHRVAIITGGPGTGKTTLIRSITALFDSLGKNIVLGAPTGRAAKRLAQVTGREASTIHRLLKFNLNDNTFERNRDNPIAADVVIIDEASMVDTFLMFHLLNAIHITSRLILVGDVFQLPSVGPGNVLSDLIQSQTIQTFELKEIFRQARTSPIIANAHRVRKGETIDIQRVDHLEEPSDFYFVEQYQPDRVVNTIVELCTRKIPQRFSFDPIHGIQVLTPMHKGPVGTINLNRILQEHLNPNPGMIQTAGHNLKLGDKVMHLKNNYQKEVFNGDTGTISDIDLKNKTVSIDFDDKTIDYDFTELEELSLAYAITVHKSQGSEYPAVIVPILTQHFAMLQRNLLYTAITRGEKLVVLIGTPKALTIAIDNDRPRQRASSLAHRLQTL